MKKHNIIKGALGVILAGMMTSCASDYLDIAPKTSLDAGVASTNVEGAELSLYGTCASMYAQWSNFESYFAFNGESSYLQMYGEIPGSDLYAWQWGARTRTFALNWEAQTNTDSWIPLLAWIYNYTLIGQANNVLVNIEHAEGDASKRDLIRAQFLTIRAHAYHHLLQCFAPRWVDSKEGEVKCLVLRTTPDTGDSPLVSMNTILDQIYSDLNTAIELYESCGLDRTYKWEPNLGVAKGIYARTALLKNDFKTAQAMAHDARNGYNLMSYNDYKSGFCLANSEYMWNNDPSPDQIYYFAFGSWYAVNGPYNCVLGWGTSAINYDLFRQIPDGGGDNVYKDLFLNPDMRLMPGITRSMFWDEDYVDPSNMNMNGKVQKMNTFLVSVNNTHKPAVGSSWPNANSATSETSSGTKIPINFGCQYKFWGTDEFGSGIFPYMRASELLLTEAESAYMNGDLNTAKNLINQLAEKRVPGYTCTKSGEDLLNEIRVWRRIELWGEGHSWFDLKRWNLPFERRPWVAGDETSNNIPQVYAVKFDQSYNHGWRYAIPRSETNYNRAIGLSDLGY
ncbi:MAG: RagB/SusD family nutrient uptake outer membrane protein [Prevotella sp.]|nr:RagB/SusD family nutrient uptake outer membrane protein [Bacteroides sp.]MCM1366575.1 RagB/SusD family nutrient uptake outer membrane protein [Prevotella sp.]MCM1437244.1 RagB/SusD family nutrient uptake outer membrane protein [Prevotella sp.]